MLGSEVLSITGLGLREVARGIGARPQLLSLGGDLRVGRQDSKKLQLGHRLQAPPPVLARVPHLSGPQA